jgi:ArsR family transcriptional regulator
MNKPVDILKAISDHGRLRILKILEKRSLCVCEITELIGLATSTVSAHLSQLKNAGLIEDEKEGKWINYHLAQTPDPLFAQIWPILSERLGQDAAVCADRERADHIDRHRLCSTGR